MPGYYVHLAATNPAARQNRNFVCGVESPDLLKKYFKFYGLDGAKEKYNYLKTNDMPEFEYFETRVQQEEIKDEDKGLHYGTSSNPNIMAFWNSLTIEQKKNPFYIGYLWHLLTDLLIYKYLDIENKFEKELKKYSDNNYYEYQKKELDRLHADWDKTNFKIKVNYPDVLLPREIKELGIVKFINDEQLSYIDFDIIKYLIDYLRNFNPIVDNIDDIIMNIISILPNSNEEKNKYVLSKKIKRL